MNQPHQSVLVWLFLCLNAEENAARGALGEYIRPYAVVISLFALAARRVSLSITSGLRALLQTKSKGCLAPLALAH
jgi:hypothetical protein